MVDRYIINYDGCGEQLHPSGDFVHYSDYTALEAQLAERTRVAELLRVIEHEATKQPGSPEARLKRIADYSREALSALEATPPAQKVTEGEWREVPTDHLLKGRRRSPTYFPATGEVCEVSGPNCDNADGYTWCETTVLWQNEIFVLYGSEGYCWPTLHRRDYVLFRPLTAAQEAGRP